MTTEDYTILLFSAIICMVVFLLALNGIIAVPTLDEILGVR